MILVLIGPPGSGKGTISNYLKNKYNFVHISTGDLLREEVKSGSDLGKEIAKLIDHGQMVPDQLSLKLMKKAMNQSSSTNFILDGYPRNLVQLELMKNDLLSCMPEKDVQYIGLDIPFESLIDRISNRYTCPQCGEIYNLISKKPIKNDSGTFLCRKDNTLLTQRKDDTREYLETRYKIFKEVTVPVINLLNKDKNFHMISSDVDEKQLISMVCKSLKL